MLLKPILINFFSQASQDQFVYYLLYGLLNKQNRGYYLEIGAADAKTDNNTYCFENEFGWKGISIDIDPQYKKTWHSNRTNPLVLEDASNLNYQTLLQDFPHIIDYLSLDIDSSYDRVLQNLFLSNHIFKIITIEHDFYRYGDKYQKSEREILTSHGYYLLCSNVSVFFEGKNSEFEDWWIHPSAFPPEIFSLLTSLDLTSKSHDKIITTLRNAF